MFGWLRRWPPYALNGLSVSIGVGLVHLVTGGLSNVEFARYASIGAVLASIPHMTGRALPTLRSTLVGGLLASLAMLIVLWTGEHGALRGGAIGAISFLSLMGMAWGKQAGPIVFSVALAMIFGLALSGSHEASAIAAPNACGVVLYSAWAFANARLLEPRYRKLAVVGALEAAAALLRARGAMLAQSEVEAESEARAHLGQVNDEARLADALQAARDLVFPVAAPKAAGLELAILLRIAELREILLTARLDLDLLGHDHAARFLRARLALGLRKLGEWLEQLARHLRDAARAQPGAFPAPELPDLSEARSLFEDDERARLLPLITTRLRLLSEEVGAIRALLLGEAALPLLATEEIEDRVTGGATFPLAALAPHLSLGSPVLRHALRSALAFTSVYFLAYALPWATRPYWLLLSVVVVLRGTLDDTLSRRNARVLGTAMGCVAVAVMVPLVAPPVLAIAFVVAVGVSHAFVNVRYLLTAISATVMALLQAHFMAPTTAVLVLERLLDTVLGALFAWGFSYVLPSWERRTLPASVARALEALRAYGQCTLDASQADPRLARQRAYDALAVIAAALQRSSAEPEQVRPPVKPLTGMLDHAQRLMAHLSSLRGLLQRRAARLPVSETKAVLAQALRAIDESLSTSAPRDAATDSQAAQRELPEVPPDQDPMPWLLRRIDASIYDARAAGEAARAALGDLARG